MRKFQNFSLECKLLQTQWKYNYDDTPNIVVKVFMRVTQRLLERNRDVFKPIMEFRRFDETGHRKIGTLHFE
jgi:hypothetical protein